MADLEETVGGSVEASDAMPMNESAARTASMRRRENATKSTRVLVATGSWEGSLPPPAACEQFERIMPGFTRETFDAAKNEGAHRQRVESTGQWMGFFIAGGGLFGSFSCVFAGHDWAGVALGGVDLVALAGLFVFREHVRSTESAGE